jgi:thioredoxin-dependent peroxiredoxin
VGGEFKRLVVGDAAPEIALLDQDSMKYQLSKTLGTKTIVYFYPAAGSPGCTKEAADFQDHLQEFENLGYSIVGISPDSVAKIKTFQEAHDLEFPLLSDPDFAAHKAYGAYGEKVLYGRTFRGALRSTIIIDETGKVQEALYNVKATGHTNMLLKKIS